MERFLRMPVFLLIVSLLLLAGCQTVEMGTAAAGGSLMLVGIDEKIDFIDGAAVRNPPGDGDKVMLFDISSPAEPRLAGSINLMNSIYGPPSNLIITPDEKLGLVTNPVDWVNEEGNWKAVPDNKLYLLDLENELALIDTVTVGKQPSGLDLTVDGSMLFIGNRAEPTVTVLAVGNKSARVIETVSVSAPVDAVSVTPDGKLAVFTMRSVNKIGFLRINGGTITYDAAEDITVGMGPYNVEVSPLGTVALVNNIGPTGGNDGHVDTVSVIDLTSEQPRLVDWVGVGDGPEGLAFSPNGKYAASVLINGTQSPRTPMAANKTGTFALLAIDGTRVTKLDEIEVGGMPEGVVFSRDSRYMYVGNFSTNNMTVLKLNGKTAVPVATIDLPGSPASMRGTM